MRIFKQLRAVFMEQADAIWSQNSKNCLWLTVRHVWDLILSILEFLQHYWPISSFLWMDWVEHLVASVLNGLHQPTPFSINSFHIDSINLRHEQAARLIHIDYTVGYGDWKFRVVIEQFDFNNASIRTINQQLVANHCHCEKLLLHHLIMEDCTHFFNSKICHECFYATFTLQVQIGS